MSGSSSPTTTTPGFKYPTRPCDWCLRDLDTRRLVGNYCQRCIKAIELAGQHAIVLQHGEGAKACSKCKAVKRYSATDTERSDFPLNKSMSAGISPRCRDCTRGYMRDYHHWAREHELRRARERYDRLRSTPEGVEALRTYWREQKRQYRSDPERRARINGDNRMRLRFKAEREGRTLARRPALVGGYREAAGSNSDLPEAPLRAWLNAVILCNAKDVDDPKSLDRLADELGVNSRQLNGIQRAEYARRNLSLADTLLTHYDRVVEVPGYGLVWRVEDLWPVELGEVVAA